MNISLFQLLRKEFGTTLQPLRCSKATLVHLSHTLEDLVLTQHIPALLFTGFQESSHWREETERYRALAAIAQQVCIFAGGQLAPESEARELHVTLRGDDPLRQEWFLLLLSAEFSVLLCGQDRQVRPEEEALRQFDTLWTFDPTILARVLDLLEQVIASYRPERLAKLQEARRSFPLAAPDPQIFTRFTSEMIRFEEELHYTLHRTTTALNEQLRWRDDLTNALVHDLRTPLQGMVMALDMIETGSSFDAATLTELLQMAKRSSLNLAAMVQLILDTNQLAAGQLSVIWQPMPTEVFVRDALESLRPLLNQNQHQLDMQIDPQAPVVWGDRSLLTRVVQNLVGNAIKFTPSHGQIIVGISRAPSGNEIELRVRDSGAGIAPAALPAIFDRFYQAPEGERKGGNGLGLYFCRLAIEAHGGYIRAASQLGSGTTITAVLPASPPV